MPCALLNEEKSTPSSLSTHNSSHLGPSQPALPCHEEEVQGQVLLGQPRPVCLYRAGLSRLPLPCLRFRKYFPDKDYTARRPGQFRPQVSGYRHHCGCHCQDWRGNSSHLCAPGELYQLFSNDCNSNCHTVDRKRTLSSII